MTQLLTFPTVSNVAVRYTSGEPHPIVTRFSEEGRAVAVQVFLPNMSWGGSRNGLHRQFQLVAPAGEVQRKKAEVVLRLL